MDRMRMLSCCFWVLLERPSAAWTAEFSLFTGNGAGIAGVWRDLADSRSLKELFELIYNFPKVVIGGCSGSALAGGLRIGDCLWFWGLFRWRFRPFCYTEWPLDLWACLGFSIPFGWRSVGQNRKNWLLFRRANYSSKAAELGLYYRSHC